MGLSAFSFSKKIGNFTIKDEVIRYVEMKQAKPFVLHTCEERWLPDGLIRGGVIQDFDTLSMIMDECVQDWGIKGRKVRFTVPDPFVVIRKLSVPGDLRDDEIRGHLYIEIGSSIHLPFEEVVFDYIVLSRNDKQIDILLFASSEELVRAYTDLLEGARLKPIAADISPLCNYRLYSYGTVPRQQSTMLIQFDLTSVNLSIFQNKQPVFMRNIEIEKKHSILDRGEITFQENRELVFEQSGDKYVKLTVSKEEFLLQVNEIVKEIDHVLNFYRFSLNQGSDEVSSFLLAGDHPMLQHVYQSLTARYDMKIDTMQQVQAELADKSSLPASFYLTAGLALKEVQ